MPFHRLGQRAELVVTVAALIVGLHLGAAAILLTRSAADDPIGPVLVAPIAPTVPVEDDPPPEPVPAGAAAAVANGAEVEAPLVVEQMDRLEIRARDGVEAAAAPTTTSGTPTSSRAPAAPEAAPSTAVSQVELAIEDRPPLTEVVPEVELADAPPVTEAVPVEVLAPPATDVASEADLAAVEETSATGDDPDTVAEPPAPEDGDEGDDPDPDDGRPGDGDIKPDDGDEDIDPDDGDEGIDPDDGDEGIDPDDGDEGIDPDDGDEDDEPDDGDENDVDGDDVDPDDGDDEEERPDDDDRRLRDLADCWVDNRLSLRCVFGLG